MQNLVVVSHIVDVGGPEILATLGTRPLGMGAWLTTRKTLLPHFCYKTKFGRSRSKHMGVGRVSQNWGTLRPRPLGMVAWLTP